MICSHVAQVGQFRRSLRESGVLSRLVDFLQSSNDTVRAMACGALWNLSARSPPDQVLLREHGAVPLLRSLSLHSDKAVSTDPPLNSFLLSVYKSQYSKLADLEFLLRKQALELHSH